MLKGSFPFLAFFGVFGLGCCATAKRASPFEVPTRGDQLQPRRLVRYPSCCLPRLPEGSACSLLSPTFPSADSRLLLQWTCSSSPAPKNGSSPGAGPFPPDAGRFASGIGGEGPAPGASGVRFLKDVSKDALFLFTSNRWATLEVERRKEVKAELTHLLHRLQKEAREDLRKDFEQGSYGDPVLPGSRTRATAALFEYLEAVAQDEGTMAGSNIAGSTGRVQRKGGGVLGDYAWNLDTPR